MSVAFSARRETALALGTYARYLLAGRAVANERGRRAARRNAAAIAALGRRLGLDLEPALQRGLAPRRRVIAVANVACVTLNVGLTVGWLALLFARHERRFHRLRRAWTLAYPPAVAGVVLVTGNHFLLDVAAGALVGVVALRWAAATDAPPAPIASPGGRA